MTQTEQKRTLGNRIAEYVVNENQAFAMKTEEERSAARLAIREAVAVLTDDIGASQDFLNAIGVDVDLYRESLRTSPTEPLSLHQELRALTNRMSLEKDSDTPDHILATYLIDCLKTWNRLVSRRDRYYNFEPNPAPELDVTAPKEDDDIT